MNPPAWLAFELCDGRPWDEMEHAYHRAIEPVRSRAEASGDLAAAIQSLERNGIVQRCANSAFNMEENRDDG